MTENDNEGLRGIIIPKPVEDEMRTSYLTYAMSVIVSRALPDVRDGLKPVHRRILYSMNNMGLRAGAKSVKCAHVVGDVMAKYHPHGDASIYDSLVRMAQDFSLRYPLIIGQGNFGSIDGDPPAAYRYTESRMAHVADEMLRDIKKETIDFVPNYDDSHQEPSVLPAALPNLLLNGSNGIAVGMATNMAPHNLTEVCNALIAYIQNPDLSIAELMMYITGPDFPTGAEIYGMKGIRDAYETGHGKIVVRAKYSIEERRADRFSIIIHEIPYMVNKSNLVEKIAGLVKDKKVEGISDIRDESNRKGMRIVIDLKRSANSHVIINQLFTHTQLQSNFNVNALALVAGRPQVLNLKKILQYFVEHRLLVITRRIQFDLKKAQARAHILEGLKIAQENIDAIVALIKASKNVEDANERLMMQYNLSEIQATAILEMRLQKLTSLEVQKISNELIELYEFIAEMQDLLLHETKRLDIIIDETRSLIEQYGDKRRSVIVANELESLNMEDLIQEEQVVMVYTARGYIKRVSTYVYRVQSRGGKGANASKLRDDDNIRDIFIVSTHQYILYLTNKGRAFWMKAFQIPEGTRNSRGQHIRTILPLYEGEEVATIVNFKEFCENEFIFFITRMGVVKRVCTREFINAKMRGIVAISLRDNDCIVSALHTDGINDIMLFTRMGRGLRFKQSAVRSTGRTAMGIKGIKLQPGDETIGGLMVSDYLQMLVITTKGAGKRAEFNILRTHGTNTQGQIIYKTDEKSGHVAAVLAVHENDLIMLITQKGLAIRFAASSINAYGSYAKGVRAVNIASDDQVVSIARGDKDVVYDNEDE